MSQLSIVYKSVREVDGKYFSCLDRLPSTFQLEYKIGQSTKPIENSKIFIFDNLDAACEFEENRAVLKCVAANAKQARTRLPLLDEFMTDYNFAEFWLYGNNSIPVFSKDFYICDELLPFKVVKTAKQYRWEIRDI